MAVNPSDSDASLTSTGLRVYVVASMSAADFFNTCPMAMVYGNTALWKLLVGHVFEIPTCAPLHGLRW